jgi:hypothetical protein
VKGGKVDADGLVLVAREAATSIIIVLGIIGGLTGPLSLAISYLTYRRDASRIRVRLRRGYRITQGPGDDAVRAMLAAHESLGTPPPSELYVRDPDKDWAYIEVANVGRRKAKISKIGWAVGFHKYELPSTFYLDGKWLPLVIDEGESKDFPIEERQVADAIFAWAIDATGRIYRGSFRVSIQGAVARLLTAIGLTY